MKYKPMEAWQAEYAERERALRAALAEMHVFNKMYHDRQLVLVKERDDARAEAVRLREALTTIAHSYLKLGAGEMVTVASKALERKDV